jgi:PD-(D/E)XK nuclease superfamily protein
LTVHLPVVSNSEIECFRRCARLHLFKYILLRRPIRVAEPLDLGTLNHAGQEAWGKAIRHKQTAPNGHDEVSPLSYALAAIEKKSEKMGKNPDGTWRRADDLLRVQAEELMIGYHCRWIDEPWEILEVEQQFECEALDPVLKTVVGRLGGKMDMVVKVTADDYIVEHKSTSFDFSAGSHYWERTRLSSQLGLYFYGARSLGYRPAGTIYDVIGKPSDCEPKRMTPVEKRRFTKAGELFKNQSETDEKPEEYRERLRAAIQENPERFYARRIVVRLASEIDAAVADLVGIIDLMNYTKKVGTHPRNVDSCWDFGRRCEYYGVCTGEENIRDDHKFRTAHQAHEELGVI